MPLTDDGGHFLCPNVGDLMVDLFDDRDVYMFLGFDPNPRIDSSMRHWLAFNLRYGEVRCIDPLFYDFTLVSRLDDA